MKKILIILTIITISFSCKKEIVNGTFTIKGHLYNDCDKIAIKNYPLLLRNYYFENNYPKYVTLATDTTDANGYFEFTYTNPVAGINIYISDDGGVNPGFINNIPIQNIDSLNVYGNPTCNVNVKLNVQKAYTSNDILEINDLTGGNKPNKKIAGPFTGSTLYTVPKYALLNAYYFDATHPIVDSSVYVGYNLNNTGWKVKRFVPLPCASVDVVIDIK